MTTERLNAWARLFLAEPPAPPDPPTVMVTTSRAVLEEVMEAVPQAQQVAFFERIPVTGPPGDSDHQWRQRLGSCMLTLSHPDPSSTIALPVAPGGGERGGSLSVYRIAGVPTDTVVERWIAPDSATPAGMPKETALLALMEVRNL